jgi:methionyl aminopeptidase
VQSGLCVAIEPMITFGDQNTFVLDDDWGVATRDNSDGAHWEHSVAVHDDGIWVLTAVDGGAEGLKPFGIAPVFLG